MISDRFKIETKDSLMRHFKMNKKRITLIKNLELLSGPARFLLVPPDNAV
jgi:hypothetical protein